MRKPAPSDFTVQVDGIGTFTFAARTREDKFRIGAEYNRLTGGLAEINDGFFLLASAQAAVSVLLVDGPAGFRELLDLSQPDPMDDSGDEKIVAVYLKLREKEVFFRKGSGTPVQAASAEAAGNTGVLDPAQIQPTAQ